MTMFINSAYLIFNQILVFCSLVFVYDIKCPEISERNLTAKGFCSRHTSDRYACLYDVNGLKHVESCDRIADYSSPGEKYVISGARTTKPCFVDTYQPFALWANISSRCLYHISKCNDEGQILSPNVSKVADRSCQCDHKNGFHFVIQPRDPCGCLPVVEDCSCYHDADKDIPISVRVCIRVEVHSSSVSYSESKVNHTEPSSLHFKHGPGVHVLCVKGTLDMPLVTGNLKLVVAIDIGTTSSVYAYSISTTPSDIQLNKPWDSGTRGLCSPKTPTCILLSKDFEPINIGYEAQKEYSDHIYDKEDDNYLFVDKFKMKLYEAQNITEKMTIKDIKGHSVPAIQVFSSMIRLLKKRAEKEIKNFYSISINHTTQWVLTIPAVWTDRAETFMRTCAGRAGIPHAQLMIVVESESASVYIHHLIKEHKLKKSVTELPKKYLVIDLGGGTDDITAHRISKHGNLKEISKPSGSANGGKKVDKHILSCLEEIAGENVIKTFKTKGSFLELLDEFENINNLLSISSQKTKIAFKFPLNLLNELCREHRGKEFQEILKDSKYYNKLVLVNDRMRIDRELIVTFISQVASDIVEDIKYALQKARTVEIKTFIVVGGFSNSYVIRDKLKNEFPDVEIIYPPFDVDLAVVKGSVLYGHNPNYIKPCSKRANLK
ncbi:heat shock 70 kDa protein 12B-like isoform X2 [Mytilus galloprovincialis]|uniref:heat shock 70 kDa protein 12B-like isoform X2 n=1 Tax=Mytilus galloprovincialis TaxID=29158 RepID=UPI003F7B6C79